MKRLMNYLSIGILSLSLLLVPDMSAQGRDTRQGERSHQSTTGNRNNRGQQKGTETKRPNFGGGLGSNRPNNNRPNNTKPNNANVNRPNNGNNHRPGQGVGNRPNNGNNHRPGQGIGNRPNNGNNHRPDQGVGNRPNNGNNHRPGQGVGNRPNNGNNHRPDHGVGNRPNNNWHFGGNHRPNYGNHRPGHGLGPNHVYRPGHHVAPPMRPMRPVHHAWRPPVPPRHWRPAPHAPNIASILGLAFGSAFNISINYLIGNGYMVDGYSGNTVYLRDINQFNYYWPDATLYYGNGGLSRSEFLYSSSYPDAMRYNSLYNDFMAVYGPPVSVSNAGSLSATWFAPNRGYITLNYAPQYSMGGQLRYFTTVTIGL